VLFAYENNVLHWQVISSTTSSLLLFFLKKKKKKKERKPFSREHSNQLTMSEYNVSIRKTRNSLKLEEVKLVPDLLRQSAPQDLPFYPQSNSHRSSHQAPKPIPWQRPHQNQASRKAKTLPSPA